MRRLPIVLLVAVAAAGCGVRTETVPGPAAPLTASGTASGTPTGSPKPTTPATTTPPPSATPTTFRTVSMTGGGLTITFPVPTGWDVSRDDADGRTTTDATVRDEVLLRVDLTARGPGTARDGAERNEATIKPRRAGYARLGIADVGGVGDDAVDWTYRYELDGTPARAINRQILSGPGGIAVLLRAPAASYDRYLPVWQRVVDELDIRTS
jgi:hypothetical protein